MNKHQQEGVGLMEILVALLILAIGVLGFVALQYRAIEASTEGEARIQAMNIARDAAEKIRVNRTTIAAFQTAITSRTTTLPTPNCYSAQCNATQKARFDAIVANRNAQNAGMTLNMLACPGVSNSRRCIIVAWGDTAAVSSADDPNDCTNAQGVYNGTSTCVIMEAY